MLVFLTACLLFERSLRKNRTRWKEICHSAGFQRPPALCLESRNQVSSNYNLFFSNSKYERNSLMFLTETLIHISNCCLFFHNYRFDNLIVKTGIGKRDMIPIDCKTITDTSYCLNDLGFLGILFNNLAQPSDMYV